MVPPPSSQNPPLACYLQHFRVTASDLLTICSISEPKSPTCSLFAAFESHMLLTYDIRAVHSIYMFFLPGIPIYRPSHRVSTFGSLVASDWYIPCVISIHYIVYIYIWITYIPLVAKQIIYTDVIHIYTIIYNLYLYATSKTARPQPPTTGGGGNYMVYDCFAAW